MCIGPISPFKCLKAHVMVFQIRVLPFPSFFFICRIGNSQGEPMPGLHEVAEGSEGALPLQHRWELSASPPNHPPRSLHRLSGFCGDGCLCYLLGVSCVVLLEILLEMYRIPTIFLPLHHPPTSRSHLFTTSPRPWI